MNRILALDGDMEKNRADHRHHAIDAIVIALTRRSLFQSIARLSAKERTVLGNRRLRLDPPWPGFPDEVKGKIGSMIVSHAPSRKIAGAFHKETAYGLGMQDGRKIFVRRVSLAGSFKTTQVKKIRDAKIRALVSERMDAHGGNAKKAFAEPLYLEHSSKNDGGRTEIRSVRLAENSKESSMFGVADQPGGEPFKYHPTGGNHHVEIIENGKTRKRKGVFVTTLEAARRARIDKVPVIQRDHGPDWKFIMSLMINDMVEIEEEGKKIYCRVQKISDPNITFRLHTASTLDNDSERIIKNANTLRCRKLTVTPLGKMETAHD